ncbi:MAG: antibiotic transporter [Chlamydiales bacterium]|nr:antibiotic transporter [Chlamydiales bacterium]
MIERLIHLTFLFLIILDPLGNVPIFVGVLKHLDHTVQRKVIIREMLIALGIMVIFLFFGNGFFQLLNVGEHSLEVTGGVILFLIALPMIFSHPQDTEVKPSRSDPLIVPLAVPAVAGPAILAAITVYGGGVEQSKMLVLFAILISWILTLPVLLLAPLLKKYLGENGLVAIEQFFGYLIILVAGKMILHGILGAFQLS